MENELYIAFGVPSAGYWTSAMATQFAATVAGLGQKVILMPKDGCLWHDNCNQILVQAVKVGCTHAMLIDTDMLFEADAVLRLLAHKKEITGVSYNYRRLPLNSTIKFFYKRTETFAPVSAEEMPKELFCETEKCDLVTVPSGFMLIDLSIFRSGKVSFPYFWFDEPKLDVEGSIVNGTMGDVWFGRKAFRAGVKLWCDPTINVKHIGDYQY